MNPDELQTLLRELALDLRWSWNHLSDEIWSRLHPELWEHTNNAWVVLQTVSRERLEWACTDAAFTQHMARVIQARRARAETRRWFPGAQPDSEITAVAYFSMEYMLSEALPIYSGGLGNVAGDQLKAASDLGVPLIAVGLLFQQGYFRQHIDADGRQQAFYPFNDPGQLPVEPVRDAHGEWLRIRIAMPGSTLWLRTWHVHVGQTKLYLLDTNDAANLPEHRGITSELYGGGPELRFQQERVLGIGGWRLLRAVGLNPQVCHLNEGHAAFAVLERARDYMQQTGLPFHEALAVTRAGNLFTTHTPVAAGFDRFSPHLLHQHMRDYAETELRIPFAELLALGRTSNEGESAPFNMAYLAARGSGAINAVSRLHEQVSHRIFQPLFPRWPESEVPVHHVTNGVHTPSWDSDAADRLWTNVCGKDRWRGSLDKIGETFRAATPGDLWQMRSLARQTLVSYVRERLAQQLAGHGAAPDDVEQARNVFDRGTLTIGFARRFAAYKRPNLLLRDPERLLNILTNARYPVQIVLAGKAHPKDTAAQEMIREWVSFVRQPRARGHAVFLADYDMHMAQRLVQGVDVWLNTPRRPWEASGTSGMKVLVNGGLNLSVLDGWWAEAFEPGVGWSVGDGEEHSDEAGSDAAQSSQIYDLLERQIVPEFYRRDQNGIPAGWVDLMRESMVRLTPRFSANRTVREYTEEHYVPAARAVAARMADHSLAGAAITKWRKEIEEHWPRLRFAALSVQALPDGYTFSVQVYLDDLDPGAVRVELFADAAVGGSNVCEPMERGAPLVGSANSYTYSASLVTTRPATHFTPRIVPWHAQAAVPLECAAILWY